MSDMSPRRTASLLERAAEVYDFETYRARDVIGDPVRVEEIREIGLAPDVSTPLDPSRSRQAIRFVGAIDRALLAERGLLVPGAPVGALAEEFRLVKRHLLATARTVRANDPTLARAMLVCSARPDDGKTYCAINLAISLAAERDVEVLLIDADFAKPDVMDRLGLKEGPGLLDLLADSAMDAERYVVRTDIPHLTLLPCGTRSNGDTELLASKRTGEVIAALLAADERRILIFDSPPALAASPASVLANHVGQVMLVVRADRTSDGDLREAVTLLDGCDHIQLVLNAVAFAPGGRRFGTYYGSQEDAT